MGKAQQSFPNAYVWLVIVLVVSDLPRSRTTPDSNLTFVFAISRHGHRSPTFSIYPPDQYQEKVGKYFPQGFGQLTKEGKQLMYKVGEALHRRYTDFLGQEYKDGKVLFTATESPRAVMSAMLVASAMFPPQGFQVWKEDLKWQPIPVFTDTKHFDKHHVLNNKVACPGFYAKIVERSNILYKPNNSSEHQQIFQFLSNKTGSTVTTLGRTSGVHDFLDCLKAVGAPLPEWAAEVYPTKTKPYAMKFYQTFSDDEVMQQLFAGPVLHKIKSTLQERANGESKPNRLMHFHSSHDMVIRPLLVRLGFNITDRIHSGDTVLFELHFIENSYKVKVIYFDPMKNLEEFLELPVNGCGLPCELDKFVEITNSSLAPNEWQLNC